MITVKKGLSGIFMLSFDEFLAKNKKQIGSYVMLIVFGARWITVLDEFTVECEDQDPK